MSELPEQLREALKAVPVSREGLTAYRPCEVELDDGQVLDGVYLVEARSYFSKCGVAPWNYSWKRYVPLERIRDLRDSPTGPPPTIANELYEHGEDGMGYCVFELVLPDGLDTLRVRPPRDRLEALEALGGDARLVIRRGDVGHGRPPGDGNADAVVRGRFRVRRWACSDIEGITFVGWLLFASIVFVLIFSAIV